VKSKAIDAYNNAIVLQILARAKEDAKTKQIVELVSKAYGLSEGGGSSEDSSGDTGTEDTGDGSTEASPEDDMFGELDFGGDALPDEGGSEEAAPEEPAAEEESAPEPATDEPEPKEEPAKEEEVPKDTTEEKKE
jgi:outer membrane biosynthesis protein TonB